MAELAAVFPRREHRGMSVHYWATLLMAVMLVPVMRAAGLPLRIAWAEFFRDYWVFLVLESTIGGVILYLIGAPLADSVGPLFRRYSRQKVRFLFLLPMVAILILIMGIRVGLLASGFTIGMLEVKDRAEENHSGLLKMASDLFWPAAYLFAGAIVISAYNDAIAALRYDGAAEFVLMRWDSALLGGYSVSGLAHAFIGRWPGSVPWMEVIYLGIFAQTGGCLAILALTEGRRRALQYVGTILIAFYVALACFYLWPATGPYASCVDHFSVVPDGRVVYHLQRMVLEALERARLGSLSAIGPDYYVALPSMHLVQALIALWFLRGWKRLLVVLMAFDVLLIPAILLLENHYLVDLIAAVPVAALAIIISGRDAPALRTS